MTKCTGFPPIARNDARVLILGSMPGVESLKQQQYYAHKQNGFWRIISTIINIAPDTPYEKRAKRLMQANIALWDVCATAQRKGSLDSSIVKHSVNDFDDFFDRHKKIERICFNGQFAHKLFERNLKAHPSKEIEKRERVTLPSTSPANASMRFEEKLMRWRATLDPYINPCSRQ